MVALTAEQIKHSLCIAAQYIRSLEDGTSIYHVQLSDPTHIGDVIYAEMVVFEGDIVFAQALSKSSNR